MVGVGRYPILLALVFHFVVTFKLGGRVHSAEEFLHIDKLRVAPLVQRWVSIFILGYNVRILKVHCKGLQAIWG